MTTPNKQILRNHFINEFFSQILTTNLIILFFRILSIFGQSLSEGITWRLRSDFGMVPIIAFDTDLATFAAINSQSILITAVVAFVSVLIHSLRKDFYERASMWAWFATFCMVVVTYTIGIFINELDRFELNVEIGQYIVIMSLLLAVRLIFLGHLPKKHLKEMLKTFKQA